MITFQDFVSAHLLWRAELADKKNKPDFDIEKVRQDNLCDIGKWFHGEGQELYADMPEFQAAREAHATFHKAVACSLEDTGCSRTGHEFEDMIKALKALSALLEAKHGTAEKSADISEVCMKAFKVAATHLDANEPDKAYAVLSKLSCKSCAYDGNCNEVTQLLENIRLAKRIPQ